jgi:hypothetical protein
VAKFGLQEALLNMMQAAMNLHSYADFDCGCAVQSFKEDLPEHPCTKAAQVAEDIVEQIRKVAAIIAMQDLNSEKLCKFLQHIPSPICPPDPASTIETEEEALAKKVHYILWKISSFNNAMTYVNKTLVYCYRTPNDPSSGLIMRRRTHWDNRNMKNPTELAADAEVFFKRFSDCRPEYLYFYTREQVISFHFLIDEAQG